MQTKSFHCFWTHFALFYTAKKSIQTKRCLVISFQDTYNHFMEHFKYPLFVPKNESLLYNKRGGRVAARSTSVPMVTGSNPCQGKDLFPGPRASLSHPAPNGYLTLVRRLGNAWNPQSRGLWTLHHLPTDHLSWSVDAIIFCIEGASV